MSCVWPSKAFLVLFSQRLRKPIPEDLVIEREPTMFDAPVKKVFRYWAEKPAIPRIAAIVTQNEDA